MRYSDDTSNDDDDDNDDSGNSDLELNYTEIDISEKGYSRNVYKQHLWL